jgi:hypothetical protein
LLPDNDIERLEELDKKIEQAKKDQTDRILRRDKNVRNEETKEDE